MTIELVKVEHLVTFADTVFAFSITFMALQIALPELSSSDANSQELMQVLISKVYPKVFDYVVSFLVVSLYWIGFHRTFNYIKRSNIMLIWLVLIFLLFVTFVSFTTAMVIAYGKSTVVLLIYISVLASTGFILTSIFYYALKANLMTYVKKEEVIMQQDVVKYNILRSLIPSLVYISTIPIAFIDPQDTPFAWIAIIPILFFLRRRFLKP
jgi:uncharacterized membrane protein